MSSTPTVTIRPNLKTSRRQRFVLIDKGALAAAGPVFHDISMADWTGAQIRQLVHKKLRNAIPHDAVAVEFVANTMTTRIHSSHNVSGDIAVSGSQRLYIYSESFPEVPLGSDIPELRSDNTPFNLMPFNLKIDAKFTPTTTASFLPLKPMDADFSITKDLIDDVSGSFSLPYTMLKPDDTDRRVKIIAVDVDLLFLNGKLKPSDVQGLNQPGILDHNKSTWCLYALNDFLGLDLRHNTPDIIVRRVYLDDPHRLLCFVVYSSSFPVTEYGATIPLWKQTKHPPKPSYENQVSNFAAKDRRWCIVNVGFEKLHGPEWDQAVRIHGNTAVIQNSERCRKMLMQMYGADLSKLAPDFSVIRAYRNEIIQSVQFVIHSKHFKQVQPNEYTPQLHELLGEQVIGTYEAKQSGWPTLSKEPDTKIFGMMPGGPPILKPKPFVKPALYTEPGIRALELPD